MNLSVGEKTKIKIDSLSFGHGHGVGRIDGIVVFVPYTAPGDVAEVEIQTLKKNFATAKLLKIESSSEFRIDAPCKYFGRCGGCQWQHVNYEEQLNQKFLIVERAMRKIGVDSDKVFPTRESKNQMRYRNRIQLHYNEGKFGYMEPKSHSMIEIDDCLIAEQCLIEHATKSELKGRGRFEIYRSLDGSVVSESTQDGELETFFAQVNESGNQILVDLVLQSADSNAKLIFDL